MRKFSFLVNRPLAVVHLLFAFLTEAVSSDIFSLIQLSLCSRPPWILNVLLVEDKSMVLNNSFYLSIIAGSVDVQNINYTVVLVSKRQMLIQTKEIHLPSGVFIGLLTSKL